MLSYRYARLVHWGECDPAGVIFAPVYTHWMVEGVARMFLSVGIDPHRLIEGVLRCGLPVLEQRLRFQKPAMLHDQIEHRIRVAKVGTKSLTFEHQVLRDDTSLMEADEVRAWAVHPLAHPEQLKAVAVPDTVRAVLLAAPAKTET